VPYRDEFALKAAVVRNVRGPLIIEDLENPQPKENEVLIKVAACGVCHSDLNVIQGNVAQPLPVVPGHEISGMVEKVGSGVAGLKEGDRVTCTATMPCGSCYYCIKGYEDLCERFFQMNRLKGVLLDGTTRLHSHDGQPIGVFSMGGMAEYTVVPSTGTFALPDNLPLKDSCILGCAGFTAYGAVKNQANLRPSESVAVIGVGGIGSSVVQVAKVFGAGKIIAVDLKDEKLEAAKQSGATEVINATREEPSRRILELTEGRGVDVAFEATGRPESYESIVNLVKPGGRIVAIGFTPAGAKIPLEINRCIRKGLRLLGCYGAKARQDMPELLTLAQGGMLKIQGSITRRYKLEEVNEAFGALEKGEITGRAILEF
jgi:S-(hydroxymethyl)glutathione dehydrogenase/alcohol dehydrogenase